MSTSHIRELFDELKPGDRIEVEHTVTIGSHTRTTTTIGAVVRTEHCHHGLYPHWKSDESVANDVILLELPDGELTAVTMDEFTVLRRA